MKTDKNAEFSDLKRIYSEYINVSHNEKVDNIISNATFNDRNPDSTFFKDKDPIRLGSIEYELRTFDVCLEIVKRHPESFESIPYFLLTDSKLQTELVKHNGMILEYVLPRHQTPEMCMEAVKNDYMAIQFVHHQTPEICIEALKQDECGDDKVMKYIKAVYQTPEVCKKGIEFSYGNCLRYIANPTHEIIIMALKENGLNISDVDNQTPEYCMLAMENAGGMEILDNIHGKYQTPEICMEAIRRNPSELGYVENQTLEMCLLAIKKDPSVIYFVDPSVFYKN